MFSEKIGKIGEIFLKIGSYLIDETSSKKVVKNFLHFSSDKYECYSKRPEPLCRTACFRFSYKTYLSGKGLERTAQWLFRIAASRAVTNSGD